ATAVAAATATTAARAAAAAAATTVPTAATAVPTAATAVPTAATTAPPLFARAGLVHRQGPAAKHRAVQGRDGRVRAVTHFHEPEAARPARFPVLHDLRRDHCPVLGELRPQVVFRGGEGEVPDIQILHARPLRARDGPRL